MFLSRFFLLFLVSLCELFIYNLSISICNPTKDFIVFLFLFYKDYFFMLTNFFLFSCMQYLFLYLDFTSSTGFLSIFDVLQSRREQCWPRNELEFFFVMQKLHSFKSFIKKLNEFSIIRNFYYVLK